MDTAQNRREMIQIEDLVIGYSDQVICGPANFSVYQGAGFGVIGANGSGKSTLVQTILGALEPIAGRALMDGEVLDENSLKFRRMVAVQVSDGAFFEELSVAEHLETVARGHGVEKWAESVDGELEFFDLEAVADHLPNELSSGQRRKLLLAATLIRPAEVLILDEPEQRLDLRIRQRFYQRLERLRQQKTTVLAVTHDPMMLRSCLDEAFLMDADQGQLMSAQDGARWLER